MKVLVTGASGYIGSHACLELLRAGHEVVGFDNFSNSSPESIERVKALTGKPMRLETLDLRDPDGLDALMGEGFDAVMHFAGLKAVGESVEKPLLYQDNNVVGTHHLLAAMEKTDCRRLVFSSSCTVYGAVEKNPVDERHPRSALNPYGKTKLDIEDMCYELATEDKRWKIALLRYFNPVGAHASGTIGEDPSGIPNNLMPFIAQVAVGKRDRLMVFGDDYDTVDGTGVRDYIHVEDLAAGHVAALEALTTTDKPVNIWNLGSGRGTSVLELLHAFEKAVGRELPYEVVARRPGDVATSYADPSRANEELGWRTTRTVEDMCVDTWRWQSQNPHGFQA